VSKRRTKRRLAALALGAAVCWLGAGGCGGDDTTYAYDFDHDGTNDEDDCDPQDASIYPGAEDVYGDGIDQDCDECDGLVGDGIDRDCDGYPANPEVNEELLDCNDADATVNPGADEIADCIDNDCDGQQDEELDSIDGDGDGYCPGAQMDGTLGCCNDAEPGDCNDGDDGIYPTAEEICDGLDNDCDPSTVEDSDDDGDGVTTCEGDCDDGNILISPLAIELCDDLDNNCDGVADEDCVLCSATVPGDHATVQDAVDAVPPNGVVCVDPGTWATNTAVDGERHVQIVGIAGPNLTILDGGSAGSIFSFANSNGMEVTIAGFTLRRGEAEQGGGIYAGGGLLQLTHLIIEANDADFGGGLYTGNSTVAILDHVLFDGNNAGQSGGGLASEDSSLTLFDVTFTGNHAANWGGGLFQTHGYTTMERVEASGNDAAQGGGLFILETSTVIQQLVLVSNTAETSGGGMAFSMETAELHNAWVAGNAAENGAGIAFLFSQQSLCNNCLFTDNEATDQAGAVWVHGGQVKLQNTAALGNTAQSIGGAVCAQEAAIVELFNSSLAANSAVEGGGGVYLDGTSSLSLQNAIIAANDGGDRGGGIAASDDPSFPMYRNNDVWGNLPEDMAGCTHPVGTEGNLSEDPAFLDTSPEEAGSWDLHLAGSSPLIDAGEAGQTDPDGSPADLGAHGGPGAGDWDLDWDGYNGWWKPGPYDPATSMGLDCDDLDPGVFPDQGC